MSLVVTWSAADDKPEGKSLSALYFGADSQYTIYQKDGSVEKKYDGQKGWVAEKSPEIFAICGDVIQPKQSIDSIVCLINEGALFEGTTPIQEKEDIILAQLNNRLDFSSLRPFIVYYGTRVEQTFGLCRYEFDGFNLKKIIIPIHDSSDIVDTSGSGEKEFHQLWTMNYHAKTNEYRTCRAIYNCLSSAIEKSQVDTVGGVPQLVSLYRGGSARVLGIVKNSERYVLGRKICENNLDDLGLEWRNDCFERVDPHSMTLLKGAQAQPFSLVERVLPVV